MNEILSVFNSYTLGDELVNVHVEAKTSRSNLSTFGVLMPEVGVIVLDGTNDVWAGITIYVGDRHRCRAGHVLLDRDFPEGLAPVYILKVSHAVLQVGRRHNIDVSVLIDVRWISHPRSVKIIRHEDFLKRSVAFVAEINDTIDLVSASNDIQVSIVVQIGDGNIRRAHKICRNDIGLEDSLPHVLKVKDHAVVLTRGQYVQLAVVVQVGGDYRRRTIGLRR
mmetsp:Transcript_14409/g.24023  ORF Transcript_14409/g.24023 Transcript_14409/m.24023 type:complete len:222 (-) Transcript_14409:57-722(-)